MLQLHPPKTRYAFEKAAQANAKARAATDADARRFWLEIEAKWLHLAESYQFVERLTNYVDTVRRQLVH
jgi:predicted Ser/Thr protein kinase